MKIFNFILAVGSICLLLKCQQQPQDTNHSEATAKSEIESRIAGYLDAIKRRDVDAISDFWTGDAVLLGPGMELNRASILQGMQSVFKAGTRVHVLKRVTSELFVHGDVAYEMAKAEEVFISDAAASRDTTRNNMFIRWSRGPDGAWRFHRVLLGPQGQLLQ